MRLRHFGVVAVIAATALGTIAAPAADAAPRWAPASKATIHPGVRVSGCTANFVFYDSRYVYLGLAASCSPLVGTRVRVEGASRPGTIVYDSGVTPARGDTNDFALVRLDGVDKSRVNPSVPFWGGPATGAGRSSTGKPVYSYGSFASPSGSTDRSPNIGVDNSDVETNVAYANEAQRVVHKPFRDSSTDGWTHYAQMVLPGGGIYNVGAPVLDARGRAFGILGSWAHDTSSRVFDLAKAIKYMKATTSLDAVQLAKGTTAFVPPG